jgi:hypothetical protein
MPPLRATPRATLALAVSLALVALAPAARAAAQARPQPPRGATPAPAPIPRPAAAGAAEAAGAAPPGFEDARVHAIVAAASPQRMEADVRTLVGFGTRHTMSDTLSATRGIGAARRWIFAEFQRIAQACGGCLEVRYVADVVRGNPQTRIRDDVNVVNVVAIQRGATDPGRYVLLSGDIDSRVTDVMNATADSPGANDNASGIAAILEAARLLTRHRPDASIVYAALSGEEQGLFGGEILARVARARGGGSRR